LERGITIRPNAQVTLIFFWVSQPVKWRRTQEPKLTKIGLIVWVQNFFPRLIICAEELRFGVGLRRTN
jgi:hypothetical protein